MTDIFRTLGNRNFRLFFIGQGISLIGTWMQRIALPWLIYYKTGSPLLLGLVAFSGIAPSFILAPIAGVLVDRWDRYRIVMITQILSLIQALMLVFCSLEGNISIGMIISLNIFLGIINAFEMPARQAFLTGLINDKNDYCSALSVNSTIVNAARLIGPALAAIIISRFGEMPCFLVNAVSYLAVIVSLAMMSIKPASIRVASHGVLYELKEGFVYACGLHPIKEVLLLYGLVCLSGWPCTILMPAIAKDLLHGGAGTFSMLMTASGAGALIGALLLGSRKNISGMDTVMACATALLGIGIIALSFSKNLFTAMAMTALMGACMMMLMTSTISLIQTIIEDGKRGRIMGLYAMVFTGAAPTGSYLAGEMSSRLGTHQALVVGGLVCVIGALVFVVRMYSLKIGTQDQCDYRI